MVSTKPSPECLRTWGHGLLRIPWRIWFPAPQGPFRGFSPWRPNNRCLLLPVLPSGNLTWKKPWKIGQSMEHLWTTMERSTIANSWVNQLFLWTMASSSQTVSLPEGFLFCFSPWEEVRTKSSPTSKFGFWSLVQPVFHLKINPKAKTCEDRYQSDQQKRWARAKITLKAFYQL